MFKSLFKSKTSTQYPIGIGISELPKSIYQGKQPLTSKEFKVLVNEHFAPKIKSLGFKGRDFNYYREQDEYIECVNFWTYKLGGAIQIDLMIKFKGIIYPNEHKEIKPSEVKQENAEFLRRLSPLKIKNNTLNVWFWIFKKEPQENIKIINDIWLLFQTCGNDFFNEFENHKIYVSKVKSHDYMSFPDFYTKRISGHFEIGVVYFLFRYWEKFGDGSKAKDFAHKGLELANGLNNVEYQSEFKQYLKC